MSEVETQIVENESESEIESIEEESENLSEIPASPEIIQEEPEEVQVTERRRPWFL
jgi:hypothetical protein